MTKKKLFLAAIAPLTVALGSPAIAEESSKGVYVNGSIGVSSMANQAVTGIAEQIRHGKDFSYEIGIGYDFGKYRLEASFVDHEHNDAEWAAGNCNNCRAGWQSILATGYFDFENNTNWTPFVGFSVGSMTGDLVNDAGAAADASGFVYGVQAGTSYKINSSLDVVGKISLLRSDDLDYGNTVVVPESHIYSAQIGARYRF